MLPLRAQPPPTSAEPMPPTHLPKSQTGAETPGSQAAGQFYSHTYLLGCPGHWPTCKHCSGMVGQELVKMTCSPSPSEETTTVRAPRACKTVGKGLAVNSHILCCAGSIAGSTALPSRWHCRQFHQLWGSHVSRDRINPFPRCLEPVLHLGAL